MEQQEQQTAMYPICTLIKPDGTRCGSPAITGMNFCFHHIGGRIASQTRPSVETTGPYSPLDFVYPDSRAAIQHNLFLVVQALNERKIDNRTANTFNRLFRACELNLRNAEAAMASIKLDETPQEQRSAVSDQESEATTEADSEPDDDSVAEEERRFREWEQSPQGQSFARMQSELNGGRRSPYTDAAQPGQESPEQPTGAHTTTLSPGH